MAYKKDYSKVGKKYTTEKKPAYKPKRGALSKLMTEEEKQNAGIQWSLKTCGHSMNGWPSRWMTKQTLRNWTINFTWDGEVSGFFSGTKDGFFGWRESKGCIGEYYSRRKEMS